MIEQILSNFEGDEREVLRLILFDSTNHQLYTLGDARLDRMLQRIYEIRSASDPLLKRFTAVHPAIAERVPVLVILQDQIGHRSASAVIVRDPTGSPQNQVLLKATGDGGANLLAAVATLQDIWRREGVVPEKPVRYAVRATTELGQTQTSDLIRARKWFERILNKDPGATGQLHHSATIHIGRTEDVRRVP